MITGALKSQIDSIWDVFWSGGIANPADVIEQMTYLLSNVAVHKLRTNRPLTAADLDELERLVFTSGDLGTRQDFQIVAGAHISLPMFIRRLIGLDRQAAMEAFAEFLDHSRFTAEQIRFVNFIIDYLTQNGVMPAERLWQPPCTDFHPAGVDGVLGSTADRIVEILRDVERNAGEPSAA